MTELFVGINTGAEPLCVAIHLYIVNIFEINCKHIVMVDLTRWCIFYTPYGQTVGRWQTSPTNCNQPASGRHPQGSPAHIYRKDMVTNNFFFLNVIFSQNHTEINSDDWTTTKKTTRTIKHENFSKMTNLKVDRWALSLNQDYIGSCSQGYTFFLTGFR